MPTAHSCRLLRKRYGVCINPIKRAARIGRCRESGAAVSRLYVFGSPPITPGAAFAARLAIHPIVDRAVLLAGALLRARSCLTIPRDNAEHGPEFPHRECSSRDTEPSADSSPGSDLG